jgi:hypothetical protein
MRQRTVQQHIGTLGQLAYSRSRLSKKSQYGVFQATVEFNRLSQAGKSYLSRTQAADSLQHKGGAVLLSDSSDSRAARKS